MGGGVEAKDHFGLGWFFNPQALGADGDTSIVADFDERAHAPDIIPPGTFGRGAQDGAFFFFGVVPGAERSLAQFAMDFMGVAMGAQGVDVWVGFVELGDFFTGEIGGQTALPELVFAFDFAFGLGRGGVAQADVVEFERPAELGQRVGILREKEAVVIDVKLERASVGEKGCGQKIEIGKKEFAFVEFGAGEKTAAIIEHVEHGKGGFGIREPAMRRGVELPQFADLGALPAADGSQNAFGRDGMSQIILEGPVADLSAIELEGMKPQGFGGDEAVGRRRLAVQTFFQQVQNGLWPGFGMIAAGTAGNPEMFLFFGAGQKISGGKDMETTAGESELVGGFRRRQSMLPEGFENVADERRRMAMDELLMFFTLAKIPAEVAPAASLFVAFATLGSSKTGGGGKGLHKQCPVLKTTKLVLF